MSEEPEGVIRLTADDAFTAYAIACDCSEDAASSLLRFSDRLEAALDRPVTYAYYQSADLALQAAALIHGIAEGQPFEDGNKRTAQQLGTYFLAESGFDIEPPSTASLADWILALSEPSPDDEPRLIEERLGIEDLADLIRPCLVPVEDFDG
ncbi:MAG: Fic family protein [Chloroflexi bacterium]|nr:Fic family protein [Chloroflexota bacterium]